MFITKPRTVEYLDNPVIVREWRTSRRNTSLRVVAFRSVETGRLTVKVLDGDGRRTDCVEHVVEHEVTPDQLRELIAEWIGPTEDFEV